MRTRRLKLEPFKDSIIARYASGETVRSLSQNYTVSRAAVYQLLYRYCTGMRRGPFGPKPIPDGQPMSLRTQFRRKSKAGLTRQKIPFNPAIFQTWTDDLAWLTGLIWSDGYLRATTIEICSRDRELIEDVARLLQSDGIRPKNQGKAWKIAFSSMQVANFFRSLGLTQAKSLTAPWPTIPIHLEAAFVRGLIDGDGSIRLRCDRPGQQVPDLQVYCCGAAPEVAGGLSRWLRKHGIRFCHQHPRHPTPGFWRISIGQQESLRILHGLLYSTPQVSCLKRKRAPFDQFITTPRPRAGRPKRTRREEASESPF